VTDPPRGGRTGYTNRVYVDFMFPPDRMISHNLSPRCPGGDELCAYLGREWGSSTMHLGGGGGDEGPARAEKRPTSFWARLSGRSSSKVRIPFL